MIVATLAFPLVFVQMNNGSVFELLGYDLLSPDLLEQYGKLFNEGCAATFVDFRWNSI